MTFDISVEITVMCEAIRRGCTFVAFIIDRERGQRYSAGGTTAFEAIAWCLHEFVERTLLNRESGPARNADAKPGDFGPSSRPRRITPAPPIANDEPATAAQADAVCFEQQIPRRAAPQLFGATPQPTTTAPAKRRARGVRR